MAQTFSLDIVSSFDAGEMNNVLDQTKREILARYDFKGTGAAIDWLDADKTGFVIEGDNQYHLDAILDMVRKKAATRGISQKTFDASKEAEVTNLIHKKTVPFLQGLDTEKAKKITKLLREKQPKLKSQIQGDEVRLTSPKKDELQQAMQTINAADFDFPTNFTNFR